MPHALVHPGHGTDAARDELITEWALAARDGDGDAFERFVRATRRDVLRFVAHLSGDPHAADDLTQETYLRALTSLHGYAARSCARVWLLAIARRTVADRFRMAAARPRISDTGDWQASAERAQPRGLPGFEEGVALLDLLAALDAPRREAFVLTQLVGLPYADAAAAVGCPVGTVRSRVARARERVSALLLAADRVA
ncbi:RNA polymerase subunit sigma [Streptomyces alfalfae]|uniref:RNA polymerase subunit sigma n=1 Tax=Streptomyces alfalfae TaxID=1642299 RepID=A0ABN4VII8_9ACTN|nr:sigma-70 family RNA polymerase sigma factor [Streptomyces alfalfae]APY84920.1 RNA polymerase subunit sigma [Streptomyces alfalfae]QUI35262.1 sigma-70 family RNA polymerase sigma factor [Streptomyces alfalfae]RXX34994.1 RNA polymerase subunit sigma [Streptomyces alfalfae]RXX45799.1 RNA polymerase subunit sigma [Streptomyces alfalfae]RXX47934.1 RNA polymerase subunit sigma [Streptomyces alfalfae]